MLILIPFKRLLPENSIGWLIHNYSEMDLLNWLINKKAHAFMKGSDILNPIETKVFFINRYKFSYESLFSLNMIMWDETNYVQLDSLFHWLKKHLAL
jgi:hypothetical protein